MRLIILLLLIVPIATACTSVRMKKTYTHRNCITETSPEATVIRCEDGTVFTVLFPAPEVVEVVVETPRDCKNDDDDSSSRGHR